MAPPALLAPITIDATNKWIGWRYNVTDYETELTTGTYTSINTLLVNIQAKMRAETGAPSGLTCSLTGASGTGKIQVVIDSHDTKTFQLHWFSGTHEASDVSDILGWSDAMDETSAYTYTADYQPPSIWAAARSPVKAGPLTPKQIGSALRTSLSGAASYCLHVGYQHTYELVLAELVPELAWNADAVGADLNRDLETFWEGMVEGDPVYVFEDRANLASVGNATLRGYLVDPRDWKGAVTRPHMDYESYDVTLNFIKIE